jgi:hypothetical protein
MRPHELLASADWRMGTIERSAVTAERARPAGSWLRSEEPLMAMSAEPDRGDEVRAELIRSIERLSPDDVQRLLDLTRRLTRS